MASLSGAASAALLILLCAAGAAATDFCADSPAINAPICGASPSLTNCNVPASLTRNPGFLRGVNTNNGQAAGTGTFINNSQDRAACCAACQATANCDAWQVLEFLGCYHISSSVCSGKTFNPDSQGFADYYGTGGTLAQARCNPPAGMANGKLDPHFEITRLSNGEELNSSLTFDFHGEDGRNYCMVSDSRLEVNVQMFSLSPETVVLQRPLEEVDPFFEGTWMKGFGILYLDQNQEPHKISILLDPAADRLGKQPFTAAFDGVPWVALDAPGPVLWESPNGLATISRKADRINSLVVSISDLLELEVLTDSEKELIADPPVHFLNFNVRKLTTTPKVHGFLGQMFAPGALQERLEMGTLEGLRHREYVEGTDDDYATSGLTEADCIFNRFGMELESNDAGVSTGLPHAVSSRRLRF